MPDDGVKPVDERPADDPRDLTPSLVGRLRAGDAHAGVLLEQIYRQPMLRFCWGYLGSLEEAEDAVQEVFCKALRGEEPPDSFRPWLYRVARNHCLNQVRARARRKDAQILPPESQIGAHTPSNLTRLAQQEVRSRLIRVVGELSEGQREVLCLRYAEGLPRAEIAEVLDIPESVVKSRLFEGLKKLRTHASLLP
ncbi:MAG: sigma-70 family RNA polymerase sigma factor [Planctomycetes bacterium]|nr:sigma-70 family RNA polymerase sigma factor [Planctomycetota bacterium]